MARERVIEELSRIKGRVEAHLREKINQILVLCESYRWMEKTFTFDSSADLDSEVNRILLQLSDAVINDVNDSIDVAIGEADAEDDRDAILAFVLGLVGGKDLTERIDMYSSHLKYILEGWIAIGFAGKLNESAILADAMAYMDNPYGSPRFRKAIKEGGYDSRVIADGGFHWGSGIAISVLGGMSLTASNAVNAAYQHGTLLEMRKNLDIIGYRVVRGSGYDCEVCDELTVGVHLLSEEVLPAHPRCMCFYEPVYITEML